MLWKLALTVILRNSGLLLTGFDAIKNESLIFLKAFEKLCKNSWKGFVMEFPFRKLQAYKLSTWGCSVFKIMKNSWGKICSGVLFYRSRHQRLSSQRAILKNILENFQGGLQVCLKRTAHGYFTGKFPKFLQHFF